MTSLIGRLIHALIQEIKLEYELYGGIRDIPDDPRLLNDIGYTRAELKAALIAERNAASQRRRPAAPENVAAYEIERNAVQSGY